MPGVPVTAAHAAAGRQHDFEVLTTPTIPELSVCDLAPQIRSYSSISPATSAVAAAPITSSFSCNQGLTTLAAAAASIPMEMASGNPTSSSFDSIEADLNFAPLIKSQLDLTGYGSGAGSFRCTSPFQTLSVNQLAPWFDSPYPNATASGGGASVPSAVPLSRKRRSSTTSASISSGRESQPKFRKTENQLAVLVKYFSINRLPDRDAVIKLADVTGLSISEVKNWFRNRRLRYKDTKESSKRKSTLSNGSLTPSQRALLDSVSEAAEAVASNPYERQQQQKRAVSSRPPLPPPTQLAEQEPTTFAVLSDENLGGSSDGGVDVVGPPARRSERLRSKQEARASFRSTLFKWALKENPSRDVVAGGGASLPLSTTYDCSYGDSTFPSVLVTPSESRDNCLFGDVPAQPLSSSSASYLLPRHSTSELTPPTTPSLGFLPPPLTAAHPAVYMNQSYPDSAFDDMSEDAFGELKDSLCDLFKTFAPDSSDRLELLKALLKDLNVKERTAVRQLVNSQSNDRFTSTPQKLAKEAWKELEERFGYTQASHTAPNKASRGESGGNDTPPRSEHSDDSSSEGSPALSLDQSIVEGLKCMFQPHRDYLYAVAKRLGIGSAVTVVLEGQSAQKI